MGVAFNNVKNAGNMGIVIEAIHYIAAKNYDQKWDAFQYNTPIY